MSSARIDEIIDRWENYGNIETGEIFLLCKEVKKLKAVNAQIMEAVEKFNNKYKVLRKSKCVCTVNCDLKCCQECQADCIHRCEGPCIWEDKA